MRSRSSSGLLALLLALLVPLAAHAQLRTPRQLARALDAVFVDSLYANATWGALVVELETGRTIYARNEEKSLVPASNTKLYTTAAALDLLGPDFRYETTLWTDGVVRDGVLEGNLIVRGSGDPVIGGRFNDGDLTEVFRAWADSLRALGVRSVGGDVIGDDDRFDDVALGYAWSWDDEPFWYSAEISALSFNDNNVDFTIEAAGVGEPGRVAWAPLNTTYVDITNATVTVHPDSSLDEGYARARGTNAIRLSSEIPAGRTDTESLTVTNPTRFFVHVLREALLEAGIAVQGAPVDVDDLSIKPTYGPGLRRVATHASPPLADIVEVLNKRSQNLYAEQLLKTIGAERPVADADDDVAPGSAEMGVEAAMATFAAAGADTSRLQLVDGSGLSRLNLVTPEATMALLRFMWTYPDEAVREAFVSSLPVGGVDGTLRFRFASGAARGNVRAKTGTLSNASALSGYVTSGGGTPLAFVLMANHYTTDTSDVRDAQDQFVTLLARYGR